MKIKKKMVISSYCDRCKRKIKFENMYVVHSRVYTWHIRRFCTECTHSVEEAKEVSIRLRDNQTTMKVKFNEEQKQIIENFLKYVDDLIDKYSQMEDKSQIVIEKIRKRTYFSEEEIEELKRQIAVVIEELKKVSDIVRYYDCNTDVKGFLEEVKYTISSVNTALYYLELYSSLEFDTSYENDILEQNYKSLEKTFTEASKQYRLSEIREYYKNNKYNSISEGKSDHYEPFIFIVPDNSYIE